MANQDAKSANRKNNQAAAGLQGAQNTMLNNAQSIANQPFSPYTGTMTAPMSANEQQGSSLASSTATGGLAQDDNAKATGLIGQVANNPWNADTATKYMNPYTSAVTNAALTAENRSYLQDLSRAQVGTAGQSAFGNSRAAIQEAELTGEHEMHVGSLTATGNAAAYDKAISTWQSDNQTKLAAANAYETAGQDVTRMTSQQISDLMQTGGVARVIAQTDLANQYAQFMRQQNWSADRLQSLIGAVGTSKGSPAQTPGIQSNTANQLLGLGSTIAGLYGGSQSSTAVTYQPDLSSASTGISVDSSANFGAGDNIQVAPPPPAATDFSQGP